MTDVVTPPEGSTEPGRGGAGDRRVGMIISGRYRLDELIGEGGMGAVYRATHTHMRKRLAIKILHPEMLGLTEAVERFEREAIAGAHIEHPHVAAASDFGKLADGSHFLVLELLEGEDIRTLLGKGNVPPERALKIVRQVASALRAAHQLGIVHRDLKPENVMLVQRDREVDFVKVLDFGIAKVPVNDLATTRSARSAAILTRIGMVYGTPEYMAPEQALGEEIDGRADLYALGVVFYEMLCGKRPFEADSRVALLGMVATKSPPRLATRVPGVSVPREVEEIVLRLLQKDPAKRYRDADELIEAIDVAALELGYSIALAVRPASHPDPGGGAHRAPLPSGSSSKTAKIRDEAAERAPRAEPPRGRKNHAPRRASFAVVVLTVGLLGVGLAAGLGNARDGASAGPGNGSPAPAESAGGPSAETVAEPEPTAAPLAEPEPPRPEKASAEELTAAQEKGLVALGPLAQLYPSDPAVLSALMTAHAADKAGYLPAMRVARRLLEIAPAAAATNELRTTILKVANGPLDASNVAFEIMAAEMGPHGPDLLYELIISPSVGKYTRERAARALRDPAVKKRASPALLVADELRRSLPCARKPLFRKAAEQGDVRSLHYLRPLLTTNGCPSSNFFGKLVGERTDCYKCLGSRAELRAAVDAIEKRIEHR